MASPKAPWTEEQARADSIGKKDILTWIIDNASFKFLDGNNLKGAAKNVAKGLSKDDTVKHYINLLESKDFKQEGEEEKVSTKKDGVAQIAADTSKLSVSEDDKPSEPVKYKKEMLKKGDKLNYPKMGDTVKVYYTGKLKDGTVFDTNIHPQRRGKIQPLAFKVGKGNVIRGWDEGLMTMSLGEKAVLTIEPEWGYGRKGKAPKIPGNATLIFEVELVAVE